MDALNNNGYDYISSVPGMFNPGPLSRNIYFQQWCFANYDVGHVAFFPNDTIVKSRLLTTLGREIMEYVNGGNSNYYKRILSLFAINPTNRVLLQAIDLLCQQDIVAEALMANAQSLMAKLMYDDKLLLGWGIINTCNNTPQQSDMAIMLPNKKLDPYVIRVIVELSCWWIQDDQDMYEKFVDHATVFCNTRAMTLLNGYRFSRVNIDKNPRNLLVLATGIHELADLLKAGGMTSMWDSLFGVL